MDNNGITLGYNANMTNIKNAVYPINGGKEMVVPVGHKILLSGDTHGDPRRFANQKVRVFCGDEYPSHAIILGDFGLIWSTLINDPYEKHWIKWLDEKPWITLATLGNHENYERIYQLPLVDLYGGKAYKVSDKVYILQHGHVFTIEGKKFFNFGGAVSIDKARRQNRVSWWEEENPTNADFYRGDESLRKVNYNVDYVISHTAPQKAIDYFQHKLPFGNLSKEDDMYYELKKQDPAVHMLSAFLENGLAFRKWYFGHFHITDSFEVEDRQYQVMYENFTTI